MRLAVVPVLAIVIGCTPPYGDLPSESGGMITWDIAGWRPTTSVYLLVVDDGSDADSLRQAVASEMRDELKREVSFLEDSCGGSDDPASWHPSDTRVLVARPSAPIGEQLISPIDDPSLAWTALQFTVEDANAMADVVQTDLDSRVATAGETFQPLDVFKRTVDLLSHARAPETNDETALVESLPSRFDLVVLIAATRDDASPADVANYVDGRSALLSTVVLPITDPALECQNVRTEPDSPTPPGRLGQWTAAMESRAYGWPCSDLAANAELFGANYVAADCGTACMTHEIRVEESGTAACRITMEMPSLDACPEERGWIDPIDDHGNRTPRLVDHDGEQFRVCEIHQLDGTELQACRTTLGCDGCPSGWCATEVPELLDECIPGEFPFPLRFVGGALAGAAGSGTIVCSTVELNTDE